ncbi:hypothetical protein D3C87_1455860 [compost metagenome]
MAQAEHRRGKPVGAGNPVVVQEAAGDQGLGQPADRCCGQAGAFGQFAITQEIGAGLEGPQDFQAARKRAVLANAGEAPGCIGRGSWLRGRGHSIPLYGNRPVFSSTLPPTV